MATERINIVVQEKGSRVVKRNLKGVGTTAKTASTAVASLNKYLAAMGALMAARVLKDYSDSYTLLLNRLKLVTTSTKNLQRVTNELFKISKINRTDVEAAVELYSRMARATTKLGLGQRRLLEITDTVAKSVKISGANAQEAAGGIVQFGQALASGYLQGDELRSITENLPRLADIIGKKFGIAGGELKTFVKNNPGLVNTKTIIESIEMAASDMDTEFAKLKPTIFEAFSVLKNSAIRAVGEFDGLLGASTALSTTLVSLSGNFKLVSGTMLAGLSIFAAYKLALAVPPITAWIAAHIAMRRAILAGNAVMLGSVAADRMKAAAAVNTAKADVARATAAIALVKAERSRALVTAKGTTADVARVAVNRQIVALEATRATATNALAAAQNRQAAAQAASTGAMGLFAAGLARVTAGVGFLTAAMAANPLGAIIVVVTAVISLFAFMSDSITVVADKGITLRDVMVATFSFIADAARALIAWLAPAFLPTFDAMGNGWSWVKDSAALALDVIVTLTKKSINLLIGFWLGAFNATLAIWRGFPSAFVDIITQGVNGAISSIDSLISAIAKAVGSLANVKINYKSNLPKFRNSVEGAASDLGTAVKSAFAQSMSQDYVGQGAGAIMGRAGELAAGRQNGQLNPDGVAGEMQLGRGPKGGKGGGKLSPELEARKRLLEELRGPMEAYNLNTAALNKLLADGVITNEEYAKSFGNIRTEFLDTQTDFASGFERAMLKYQKDLSDVASQIEDIMSKAFKGMEDALVEFVQTGKLDFGSLIKSILADLIRLTVRLLIIKPLMGALTGALGGGGGGGIGSAIGSMFGFATGGSFTVGNNSPSLGLATGGGFNVGGGGGVDSQLVAFKASPGERVSVTRPGQQEGGSSGTTINFNVSTPDAQSFERSQTQIAANLARVVNQGKRNM